LLKLPTISDERGLLTVVQDELPFEVVRTYWIYGADGRTRGGHRHHLTRQALISINGSTSIYMNDGINESTINLISPSICLIVEPKDWHTMTFGPSAILLVMSSHRYDPNDYIDAPYARPAK